MTPPNAGTSAGGSQMQAAPKSGAMSTTGRAAARRADLLQRYDRNGDGRIDEDERIDAKEEMLKENIDRQMTRISLAQASPEQMRARVLELFDRNKDGRLDEEERSAAQRFTEERLTGAGAQNAPLREALIRRFDTNGNGRIDAGERAGIAEFFREQQTGGAPAAKSETPRAEK